MLVIVKVSRERKTRQPFFFSEVDQEEMLKEILNSAISMTSQDSDVPTKIAKKMEKIFRFITFMF